MGYCATNGAILWKRFLNVEIGSFTAKSADKGNYQFSPNIKGMKAQERAYKRLVSFLAKNGKQVTDEHRKNKQLIADILKRRVQLGISS